MNPLRALNDYGQSVWLDFMRRNLVTGGELRRLVEEDGLCGITSNPSIFEKAIAGSTDYAQAFREIEHRKDLEPAALYERLAIKDIQDAADILRPVYQRTGGRDGYVSLEVSPYLANDTQETINEARRLWSAVGRGNAMIKVPATPAGIPAIRQLTSEGINVNVTLLLALPTYEQVANAYIEGLKERAAAGGELKRLASVASFFVSRIDTLVDNLIADQLKNGAKMARQSALASVVGKVAIANARLAYQRYKEIYGSEEWRGLAQLGAPTQRLLWASTSTKNPSYRDVLYVEELIGPDTVDTMPPATMDAFRDHGRVRASLESELEQARDTMETLERLGISMEEVGSRLVSQGVTLFADAFDKLLAAIDQRRKAQLKSHIDRQTCKLAPELDAGIKQALEDWHINGKARRLWARDASLWTNSDEAQWLGWLGISDDQLAHIERLKAIGREISKEGFTGALLLGMGGSSLCAEVMSETFGKTRGYPRLRVLDSTDPAQVRNIEESVELGRTLFIVSSKSGTTLEPNLLKQYFFERCRKALGKTAPSHFIAITDPNSSLHQAAQSEGFRQVFFGVPSIGGRYSALSDFGMVPAAIMGVNVAKFLDNAEIMVHSCAASVPARENPGVVLGAAMGVLAEHGRDKVTIIASPAICQIGAWLEQLLAESTGKAGKGLIPIDDERLGPPEVYGDDRLFVYLRLEKKPHSAQDDAVEALERAGHPVVRIAIAEPADIGQEFFRWEIATAVAGSIIGINPFDQPDVEASKLAARKLTAEYERTGKLPAQEAVVEGEGVKLFADPLNARALAEAARSDKSLIAYLRAHLDRIRPGDYFATLAYVEMKEVHKTELQQLRHLVRDRKRVATCLGFGPRFLHSTGQLYKGGPNTGVFLQITCDDAFDIEVPGRKYSFGIVKAAQERGDFQVLAERGRRALGVHVGKDVLKGLKKLRALVAKALA